MQKGAAAEVAERAVADMTQAFARMDLGISSVIGRRVSEARPGLAPQDSTGLQSAYGMRFGFQDLAAGKQPERPEVFGEQLKQTMQLVQEQAGGGPEAREKQMLLLENLLGVNSQTARIMVETGADASSTTIMSKLSEQHAKEMKESIPGRLAEANRFASTANKLQEQLAAVGQGILGVLIDGFKLIGSFFGYLRGRLELMFGGLDPQSTEYAELARETAESGAKIDVYQLSIDKHFREIGTAVGKMGSIAGGAASFVGGKDPWEGLTPEERNKMMAEERKKLQVEPTGWDAAAAAGVSTVAGVGEMLGMQTKTGEKALRQSGLGAAIPGELGKQLGGLYERIAYPEIYEEYTEPKVTKKVAPGPGGSTMEVEVTVRQKAAKGAPDMGRGR
jgi:hypothetical protein